MTETLNTQDNNSSSEIKINVPNSSIIQNSIVQNSTVTPEKEKTTSSNSKKALVLLGGITGAIALGYFGGFYLPAWMISTVEASTTAAIKAATNFPIASHLLGGSVATNIGKVAGANAYANAVGMVGGQWNLTVGAGGIGAIAGKQIAGHIHDGVSYTIEGGKSIFNAITNVFSKKKSHVAALAERSEKLLSVC